MLLFILFFLHIPLDFSSTKETRGCEKFNCHHSIVLVNGNGIEEDENRIEWSEGSRLSWDDFQADPQWWNDDIAAITSSLIQYKYSCQNGKLNYAVKTIFLKDESWVKKKAKTTHYLIHEQLHFDITEVFSRKLKAKLSNYEFKCNDVEKFEAITKEILTDWQNTQKRYDYQSRFSLNEAAQKKWEIFIPDILDAYSDYK